MLPGQAIVLIAVSTSLSTLACVAVGLRVWARRLSRSKLDLSDYFIFFTLLNAILNSIACIIGGVACGIGLPISALPDYMQVRFMKILFVTQFFYVFSAWSVKISVLFFYRSIFSTPKFKRASNIVLYVLIAWLIAFFVTLFQDNPISRNWGTVGTTINWRIFYIIEIATNVALDLFILCMPWPVIKQLHVTKKQKWLLVAIFGLGGFIVIASIVRLAYMVQVPTESREDDFSFIVVNTTIWGAIEPCTSVIAACLPLLKTLIFKKHRPTPPRPVISSFFQKDRPRQAQRTTELIHSNSTEVSGQEQTGEVPNAVTEKESADGDNVSVTHSMTIEEIDPVVK